MSWLSNVGSTLVVGDSHTNLAGHGAQYPNWDTDAYPGRNSSAALVVLKDRLRGRHDKVVFDIATNDITNVPLFRSNLEKVWDFIGSRKLILVTGHRFDSTANRSLLDFVNEKIRNFEENHPNRCSVAKVGVYLKQNLQVYNNGVLGYDDKIHLNRIGYNRRTEIIKEAVANA